MSPNEQLMKTVLESWGNADLGPARDALADNVVWKSASSGRENGLSFGGVYLGRESVLELLAILSTKYFFQRYIAKEIISRDEIVWGLFDVYGSYLPSRHSDLERKTICFESAFRWRVRDGKILEAQSFFDTAAVLAQQGTLQTAAA